MAINQFNGYAETKAYTEQEQLPTGAYVLKIMGAEVCQNSKGQYVKISCDIAEGDYKDFYAADYRNQQSEDKKWHCNYLLNVPLDDGSEKDGWTKRRFKTVIVALEESNPGYHFDWDEKKFKGKLVGGLFNIREYESSDGSIREATNLAQLTSVEAIKTGKYKIPADKRLNKTGGSGSGSDVPGFMVIDESASDGLPFN